MDKYIEMMKKRGFSRLMATANKIENGKEVKSYIFLHEKKATAFNTIPAYMCEVWPDTNQFQCKYGLPGTIIYLRTMKCSCFQDEERFHEIVGKFEKAVTALYQNLEFYLEF